MMSSEIVQDHQDLQQRAPEDGSGLPGSEPVPGDGVAAGAGRGADGPGPFGRGELTGPGGLLSGMTQMVLETALDAELADHLGYEGRHERVGAANTRNGLPGQDGAHRCRAGAGRRCRGTGPAASSRWWSANASAGGSGWFDTAILSL